MEGVSGGMTEDPGLGSGAILGAVEAHMGPQPLPHVEFYLFKQ